MFIYIYIYICFGFYENINASLNIDKIFIPIKEKKGEMIKKIKNPLNNLYETFIKKKSMWDPP